MKGGFFVVSDEFKLIDQLGLEFYLPEDISCLLEELRQHPDDQDLRRELKEAIEHDRTVAARTDQLLKDNDLDRVICLGTRVVMCIEDNGMLSITIDSETSINHIRPVWWRIKQVREKLSLLPFMKPERKRNLESIERQLNVEGKTYRRIASEINKEIAASLADYVTFANAYEYEAHRAFPDGFEFEGPMFVTGFTLPKDPSEVFTFERSMFGTYRSSANRDLIWSNFYGLEHARRILGEWITSEEEITRICSDAISNLKSGRAAFVSPDMPISSITIRQRMKDFRKEN